MQRNCVGVLTKLLKLYTSFTQAQVIYPWPCPCVLSLAGLTWRSPPAAAMRTDCRLTLPALWKLRSRLRWGIFLSEKMQFLCKFKWTSNDSSSNIFFLFILVFSLSISTGWTLCSITVGRRPLTASASRPTSQAICSGFRRKSKKSQIHHTGIRYLTGVRRIRSGEAVNEWLDCLTWACRCVLCCCSWKVWRTATMSSCLSHLKRSPSTQWASCEQSICKSCTSRWIPTWIFTFFPSMSVQTFPVGRRFGRLGICFKRVQPDSTSWLRFLFCTHQIASEQQGAAGVTWHLEQLPVNAAHHKEIHLWVSSLSQRYLKKPIWVPNFEAILSKSRYILILWKCKCWTSINVSKQLQSSLTFRVNM